MAARLLIGPLERQGFVGLLYIGRSISSGRSSTGPFSSFDGPFTARLLYNRDGGLPSNIAGDSNLGEAKKALAASTVGDM